ncbi:MAG TPA: PKD domain-containing protein [Candidatus Paceibacterota bacterium]
MRFFNKTFFKFTLGFLSIVSLSLLLLLAVSVYAAEVSKISFITEEVSVKPNEISEAITIQSQDSSGASLQTPETIDLEFLSTSSTGEFLNSAGNPVSKTMSKNTANRTFYYKDSNIGTHTLSVKAVGRDSQREWNTSQKITVSSGASTPSANQNQTQNQNNSNSSGEVLGEDSEEDGSSLSSTGGPSSPQYGSQASSLEVLAGRDRVTAPGSPLMFQAYVKKNVNSNSSLEFDWSFGDGNVGRGAMVYHTYIHPGDYAVVLNVNSGSNFSTSRLKVKVVSPRMSVSAKEGYVEVSNEGNTEINLFNWRLESDGRGFIFQPDTIILPHSSVRFENSLLGMKWAESEGTALRDSFNRVLTSEPGLSAQVDRDKGNDFLLELGLIRNQAISLRDKLLALSLPTPITVTDIAEEIPQAEAAATVLYESESDERESGKGLTNFIKSIFSD